MKNVLLYSLFIFSVNLKAQNNWDLFPYQQKTWWKVGDSLHVYFNDLNEPASTGTTHHFCQQYYEGYFDYCFYDIMLELYEEYDIQLPVEYGWSWQSVDTAWGFDGQKYFYPLCDVGDSWSFPVNNSNGFNFVNVLCTGTDTLDILGLTTAVKYFSLSPYLNATPVQNELNNVELVLSEKAGFLRFIPFQLLENGQTGPVYEIVGFEQDGQTHGFVPSWEYYFGHFAPGDLMKWKTHETKYVSGQIINIWARDSITAVNFSDTQLVLQSVRETYTVIKNLNGIVLSTSLQTDPGFVQTFNSLDFESFWSGIPGWLGPTQGNKADFLEAWVDTSGSFRVQSYEYYYFDLDNCHAYQPIDYSAIFYMDQYCGYSGKILNYKNGGYSERLLGCSSNGHTWGDLDPLNTSLSAHAAATVPLGLYPSLARDRVCIQSSDGLTASATLVDAYGKQMNLPDIDPDEQCIDVSGLPAGVYSIILFDKGHYRTGRFVKI